MLSFQVRSVVPLPEASPGVPPSAPVLASAVPSTVSEPQAMVVVSTPQSSSSTYARIGGAEEVVFSLTVHAVQVFGDRGKRDDTRMGRERQRLQSIG